MGKSEVVWHSVPQLQEMLLSKEWRFEISVEKFKIIITVSLFYIEI